MCESLSPKEKIRKIPKLRDNRIEEDWETIRLYWAESSNNFITAIFGKRSEYYYKCPPAQNCECFHANTRTLDLSPKDLNRKFDLMNFNLNKTAEIIFCKNGWNNLFDIKKFPNAGETVVIEEETNKILFYFALSGKDKANISFTIYNDKHVICSAARVCAKNRRVTYTTFVGVIPKNTSPLFSSFPT